MATITDWLMVGITAVYVIATILICKANMSSVKETRTQLLVSQRQFDETQRLQVMPYLQMSFSDTEVKDVVPCVYLEMRNSKCDYTSTQAQFFLKNIGLGIAHHTRITVTTRYKKDDGYPAFDIVMPPNSEKRTYVRFNVEKYDGELGRKEDVIVQFRYDDVLGNSYKQEAQLSMVVQTSGPHLLHLINMKSPQLVLKREEKTNA